MSILNHYYFPKKIIIRSNVIYIFKDFNLIHTKTSSFEQNLEKNADYQKIH